MARPKGSGGQARVLTEQDLKQVSGFLHTQRHGLRDRALIYFCLGSAARIGEACGLLIQDVRAPNGRILKQVVLELHSTKSKRSRTIHLSPQAREHLKAYLDSRGPVEPDAPVFLTQKGCRLSAAAGSQLVAKIFREAGLVNASSHSLRRTAANQLRRNGLDLGALQSLMGHANLNTTAVYFRVDPLEVSRAIERLRF